jgi:DNA-binding CsgD family transcriptional regulator
MIYSAIRRTREAAARLFISEATVRTHRLHIYAKLGVSDRAAAVVEAFNRGFLTPGPSTDPQRSYCCAAP